MSVLSNALGKSRENSFLSFYHRSQPFYFKGTRFYCFWNWKSLASIKKDYLLFIWPEIIASKLVLVNAAANRTTRSDRSLSNNLVFHRHSQNFWFNTISLNPWLILQLHKFMSLRRRMLFFGSLHSIITFSHILLACRGILKPRNHIIQKELQKSFAQIKRESIKAARFWNVNSQFKPLPHWKQWKQISRLTC